MKGTHRIVREHGRLAFIRHCLGFKFVGGKTTSEHGIYHIVKKREGFISKIRRFKDNQDNYGNPLLFPFMSLIFALWSLIIPLYLFGLFMEWLDKKRD